jgi:tetratricopeptide (TPR) repeat protein
MREWYGHAPTSFQRFAAALAAARHGGADAAARVVAMATDAQQPAIARATAIAALGPAASDAIRQALNDTMPLVRLGGVLAASEAPLDQRWSLLLGELHRDSSRVLRALAGGALAGVPVERIPAESRARLMRAKADYVAAETENSDQPFGLVNLAGFHLAEGDAALAERELRQALEIDPDWSPASVNLADLLRVTGRDAEGESVLKAALTRHPESAALHHALGLWLVRKKQYDLALDELGRAATLAPDDPRFAYVYAVALADVGRPRQAQAVVDRALRRRPGDAALLELSTQLRASGTTAR